MRQRNSSKPRSSSSVIAAKEPAPNQDHTRLALATGNYIFGDVVGVDVLETAVSNRRKYQCFNIVDLAPGFQQLELLREVTTENHGPPSAEMCLEAFQRWIAWAGLPRCVMADRGTHNRGTFMSYLTEKGVDVRFAATEAPWMLGKVERHGGLAKAVIRNAVRCSSRRSGCPAECDSGSHICQEHDHECVGILSESVGVG